MSGQWLTVADAVAHCAGMGLNRNMKTVRRWAQRSHAHPENAEVLVSEQDTPNGFRYMIEKASLERKIAQELTFEATRAEADTSGQALPGSDMPASTGGVETAPIWSGAGEDMSSHSRSAADAPVRKLEVLSVTDDFLKDQIAQKDGQIAELSDQIRRRDRQIDAMLERDKETNVLINTLQETLSQVMGLESPARMRLRAQHEGDSATGTERGDGV